MGRLQHEEAPFGVPLSILYLRCRRSRRSPYRSTLGSSFNSLFEMPVGAGGQEGGGWEEGGAFNSLFEMQQMHICRIHRFHTLSILYLRCLTPRVGLNYTTLIHTFNYLFEMRSIVHSCMTIMSSLSFNSLFEMRRLWADRRSDIC